MKKLLTVLTVILACSNLCFAEDLIEENLDAEKNIEEEIVADENIKTDAANQIIEMEDNKVVVIVQKQPLNEKSNQKIKLKRNWLGVYIQINGKVKVNPLTHTYEVQ